MFFLFLFFACISNLILQCSAFSDPFFLDERGFDLDAPLEADSLQYGDFERKHKGSEGLQEFTPISNYILQSQLQYYSFNVNTSTGIGEYYEYLIFLTGNICDAPRDFEASANQSLTVYYSFNALMFQNLELGQMEHFKNGYFQALADVPASHGNNSILYIAVRAPESTNRTATWSYEIGVSQNDLVFQWDDRPFTTVIDTDAELALIITNNLTAPGTTNISHYNASLSNYQLLIYSWEDRDLFKNMNSSWCAIRNGPALKTTNNFNSSYVSRGGGIHQQFYVSGLNASTRYIGILLSDFNGAHFGGAAYQKFEFETMSEGACSLIHDLDFCDEVAYSVPALSKEEYADKDALKRLYDDHARSLYTNFSKALQQIACNTTDEAVFSPIKTCRDCAHLYKNWLCAVSIPRCSTRNVTGYSEQAVGKSRNHFVNNEIAPPQAYFEVLPCVNVCQAIVRDCPADFSFSCPTKNESIRVSYFWDTGSEYASCNFVGTHYYVRSAAYRIALALWSLVAAFFVVYILV